MSRRERPVSLQGGRERRAVSLSRVGERGRPCLGRMMPLQGKAGRAPGGLPVGGQQKSPQALGLADNVAWEWRKRIGVEPTADGQACHRF